MSNEFIVTVVQKLVTVVNQKDVLTKEQAIAFVKDEYINAFVHALKFNSGWDESSGNYTYTIDVVTKEEN